MKRKYRRIKYEDRRKLERMLQEGKSISEIAEVLGVHRDTLYKELDRSGTDKNTYTADKGQQAI